MAAVEVGEAAWRRVVDDVKENPQTFALTDMKDELDDERAVGRDELDDVRAVGRGRWGVVLNKVPLWSLNGSTRVQVWQVQSQETSLWTFDSSRS